MTPAQIIGAFAVVLIPALVALVRDRDYRREAGEVNDQRVSAWRGSDPAKETT